LRHTITTIKFIRIIFKKKGTEELKINFNEYLEKIHEKQTWSGCVTKIPMNIENKNEISQLST
jgi:hypothetical protein